MTGGIALASLILSVGGIKEKVLVTRRIGLRRIILEKDNMTDLNEFEEFVRLDMEFIPATKSEGVFAQAFSG